MNSHTKLNSKLSSLSINELIDLVYEVELSNDIVFVKNVYNIVRIRFLTSFKIVKPKTEEETTEQEILRKLYSIVNQKIEVFEKNSKVHKLQKRKYE